MLEKKKDFHNENKSKIETKNGIVMKLICVG